MRITCADCGATQTLPELPPRAIAECHRCDRVLDRRAATHLDLSLAAAGLILVLMPFAVFLPFLQSTIRNLVFDETRLITSVPVIYREVWFPFAFGFLFFAVLFPAARALSLVLVLGSIRWRWRLPQRGRIFRWNQALRVWSMTDVVVVAGVATYFRAAAPADVEILSGAWCYIAVAGLALSSDVTLRRRTVWNAILAEPPARRGGTEVSCLACEMTIPGLAPGDPCPRCGARLDADLARRFAPALVAATAALPLTLPGYEYAVIVNDRLTGLWELTILGTVQLMADRGLWLLGLVLLLAGVVIPFLELSGLALLLARVRFPSRSGLVGRTRLFRLLRSLGRWPLVIPFIAATAAPIVDFPGIDDIVAGPGATPFFLMIVLLVLAIALFEPRLMWKTAGEAP